MGPERALGQVLAERDTVLGLGGSLEQREEGAAVDRAGELVREARARDVRERGEHIEQRHRLANAPGVEASRSRDHERNMRGVLAERHLVEEPMLAEEVAVVGEEEHDGVLGEAARFEGREHLADLLVGVREARVVAVACRTDVVLRDLDVVHGAVVPQPAGVRVHLVVRQPGRAGQVDVLVGVEIPVTAARDVGVVRMAEGHAEQERDVALEAGVVVQPANRVERDLVVVLELVRDLRDPGLLDRAHVVVPPVDTLAGAAPVRCPAEVARVDVRREPLLEAVQLVRADEVHLPAQAGPVALEAQVVRERRDGRGELGRVVVHACARRQQPRHEGGARRRAERARRVGVLEDDAVLGERIDRRGPRHGMAVRPEERRRELIDHHDEDVRPFAHRPRGRYQRATGSLIAFEGRRPPSASRTRLDRPDDRGVARALAVPARVRVDDETRCPGRGGVGGRRLDLEDVERDACDPALREASRSASASTRPAREAFTTTAPGGSSAICSRPIRPRVSAVSGACTEIASEVASSSSSAAGRTPAACELLVGDHRIVRRDVHAQCERPQGEGAADPPEADDAEADVRDSPERARRRVVPLPVTYGAVELDDPAHEGEEKRKRVVGHLLDAVVGDIAHPHAAARRRLDVEVVESDARSRDHPELG